MNRPHPFYKKFAMLAIAFVMALSCSDEFPKIDRLTAEDIAAMNKVSKDKIGGAAQKGPFLSNSSIVLYELDSSLAQSGRSFQSTTDDRGSFEIKSIELDFPYALLKADGFYRNEVSGQTSIAQITLYAIADIKDKNSVNVNILTHLEYHRVKALAEEGKSIREAKRQAQGEILAVFGIGGSGFGDSEDMSIFGAGDGDAALLAVSVLLQGERAEGDFSSLLADFSQKLGRSGAWDSRAKKAEIAEWAQSADLAAIRANILGWGLSQAVPGFEEYVRNYAELNSGLAGCSNYDESNEFCHSNRVYSKCGDKDGIGKHEYNPETHFCYNNYTVPKCGGQEYDLAVEQCRAGGFVERRCGGYWYVPQTEFCHTDNTIHVKCGGVSAYSPETEKCCGTGKYVYATEQCCGNGGYSPLTHFCHTDNTIHSKCGTATFNPATEFCLGTAITALCGGQTYTSSQFCSGNTVHDKCGGTVAFAPETEACCGNGKYTTATQFCDARDSKPYKYTKISTQTWMAENLNYDASGSKCYSNSESNCNTYGRLYDWATAMGIDAIYNSTEWGGSGVKHRGICPQGWHIPSNADWDKLYRYVDGTSGTGSPYGSPTAGKDLKAKSGWYNNGNGTDNYGFSALPGGNGYSGGSFYDVGRNGYWWSASEYNSYYAYNRGMYYDYDGAIWYDISKGLLFSVRCLQD